MRCFNQGFFVIALIGLLGNVNAADQVVLCYGDSITAAKGGWVSKVGQVEGIQTLNAGIGGRRAVNAKVELEKYLERYKGQKVDRVLMVLGVNDLPARDKRPGNEKVAICVKGMTEAVDLALTRFKPEQITLIAPSGVNSNAMSKTNLGKGYQIVQPLLEQLEVQYRDLAKKKGIRFFSLLNVVSKENYTDGLHPNDAGHAQIAKAVASYLTAQQDPASVSP
jgi:lysophospholipase L1-like esterase